MPGFIARHKKFIITLLLFLLMFWLVTQQVRAGRFTFLEKPVLAISGFFERIITGVYGAIESTGEGYAFLVRTRRENVRLREEVERLKLENAITNELLLENERLRDLLGFKKRQPLSSVTAQIIGRDSSPSSRTVTINKGSEDGVEKGLPVITAEGVVGKVQAVLSGTAKIILLTDPLSTLAVRVQRNREEGLLEGRLERCSLKYVSYYADIQEGDLLVTSGLDGIYPQGLPVARVDKVTKYEASAYQVVVADPVARLSRLEEVLVLKK